MKRPRQRRLFTPEAFRTVGVAGRVDEVDPVNLWVTLERHSVKELLADCRKR
jgi:hypothetical protein